MKLRRRLIPVIATVALTIPLAACSGSSGSSNGTVNWWTWDDSQAAAYEQCIPAFEKANPGITVKISQYNSDDYFTKLTTDFVGGTAPDAFMNSVQYLPAYASQNQLEPLDDYIKKDNYNLNSFSSGVSDWQLDNQQYGLPMDWASTAVYYNKADIAAAGYTDKDLQNMTWNPQDGGTYEKIAAHMTIDNNGVRGDQPGFDKNHIATYGSGVVAANQMSGDVSWYPFAASTGWRMMDSQHPTQINYADPRFVQTMDWAKQMVAKGYAPSYNQFTLAHTEQLGSGKVAMTMGGSWEASTFAALKGTKVGIAPTVLGPDGTTRRVFTNINGNVMWAGSKNKDATWKWISYQESAACQTTAATYNASFFPSNPDAMTAMIAAEQKKGVDLSVFSDQVQQGVLTENPQYPNGAEMQSTMVPLFEAYLTGKRDDSVWSEAQSKSAQIMAKK